MARYIVSIRHFLTLHSVNKTLFDATYSSVNKTLFDTTYYSVSKLKGSSGFPSTASSPGRPSTVAGRPTRVAGQVGNQLASF